MTETSKLLELAAKACDWQLTRCTCGELKIVGGKHWAPDQDDGDNSRMRTKLRIGSAYAKHYVKCLTMFMDAAGKLQFAEAREMYADHESPDAALRLCALRVAAMMGEQM